MKGGYFLWAAMICSLLLKSVSYLMSGHFVLFALSIHKDQLLDNNYSESKRFGCQNSNSHRRLAMVRYHTPQYNTTKAPIIPSHSLSRLLMLTLYQCVENIISSNSFFSMLHVVSMLHAVNMFHVVSMLHACFM